MKRVKFIKSLTYFHPMTGKELRIEKGSIYYLAVSYNNSDRAAIVKYDGSWMDVRKGIIRYLNNRGVK